MFRKRLLFALALAAILATSAVIHAQTPRYKVFEFGPYAIGSKYVCFTSFPKTVVPVGVAIGGKPAIRFRSSNCSFIVPQVPTGKRTILVFGSNGSVATGTVEVEPPCLRITAAPRRGAAGDRIEIFGSCLETVTSGSIGNLPLQNISRGFVLLATLPAGLQSGPLSF